jgi:MFS family permease
LTLLILVQRLTGSTVALAALMVSIALPTLVFGTLSGVYVDRLDRRKTMVVSDVARAVLVLGFLFVDSPDLVPLLYVLAFAQAAIGTLFNPARAALLPLIVGESRLLAANSVSQTSRILFGLLGTGAAGVLAAVGATLAPAFIIDSATFLFSALVIMRVRTAGRPVTDGQAGVWAELTHGIRVMTRSRPLRAVLISLSVTMLGLGAVNVLFVPLLVEDLAVSEAYFGAIEASQVAGMIISGTVIAILATRLKAQSLVVIGLIGVGLFVGAISGVAAVWQVMIVLFLVGLSVGPVQAGASTLGQTFVEDSMRGRVGGVMSTVLSAANVTSMGLAGIAASAIGPRNVFLIAGCLAVVAGALASWLFRDSPLPADLAPGTTLG